MKLNLDKNDIYGWLNNTTNNIISSIVASVIFTVIFGAALNNTETQISKKTICILIIIGFIILSIIIFLIIKYYSKKKFIPIKAIVFDFDGTLSKIKKVGIKSPWELIWLKLEYKISDCKKLYTEFFENRISHEQWCERTFQKFAVKKLTEDDLFDVSKDIELLEGVKDVLEQLKDRGIKLFLVSGSIMNLIKYIWGNDLDFYFDRCEANIFRFKDNKLVEIKGTNYDFKGKAEFIREICKQQNWSPKEILFIGNSDNDESAKKSGARTLCLNGLLTNPYNKESWDDTYTTDDFSELYEYIEKKYLN
jgi:phosphoserine phosphatase